MDHYLKTHENVQKRLEVDQESFRLCTQVIDKAKRSLSQRKQLKAQHSKESKSLDKEIAKLCQNIPSAPPKVHEKRKWPRKESKVPALASTPTTDEKELLRVVKERMRIRAIIVKLPMLTDMTVKPFKMLQIRNCVSKA